MLILEQFSTIWQIIHFLAWTIQSCVKLLNFTLRISIWIGEKIVLYLVGSVSKVYYLLSSLFDGISVLCEDFTFFANDILGIFAFIEYTISVLLNLFQNALFFIVNFPSILIGMIVFVAEGLTGLLTNFFETFANCMHIVKESLILIGSSIWLCVKIVPLCAVHLISMCIVCIHSGTKGVHSFIYRLFELILYVFKKMLNFIVDTPLEAIFGLSVGLALLYGIHKNWSLVFNAGVEYFRRMSTYVRNCQLKSLAIMKHALVYSVRKLRWMVNNLKNCVSEETENIEQLAEQGSKLCVICQDNERDVIVLPCRHMCLCLSCSWKMTKYSHGGCPVCRELVQDYMRVYT